MSRNTISILVDLPGNDFAAVVAGHSPGQKFAKANKKFGELFDGIDTPSRLMELVSNRSGKKIIITHNGLHWDLMIQQLNDRESLYILRDVTVERAILTKLKDKLQELERSNEIYTEVMEKELPIGVMITDKDYNVLMANKKLKRYFHIPAKARMKKCYNYVKEIKPCDECILRNFLEGKNKNKKSFITDDEHYITAEIHPVEDKFIITFRDTTKEVNLIREIKKQQEELESANRRIAEQNDILKRLSTINIRIAQMKDPDAILETVLQAIVDTFGCEKGAILLFNEGGKIKNANFTETISTEEQAYIIENVGSPGAVPGETKETANRLTAVNKERLEGFMIRDIMDRDVLSGRIFLRKPGKNIDHSILQLFLMQVSIFLDNLGLQRKLEELVQTDSLTGVFNRYYFEKRLKEEKELSHRFGQPLSLILLDVNGLKETNDNEGHEAGDRLIKETTRLLSGNISSYDSIYRIGGDEFVILLSNCPEERMKTIMDTFYELQETATYDYNGKEFPLRFSMGGSCSTSVEYERLKEEADKRMYLDKEHYYKTRKRYR